MAICEELIDKYWKTEQYDKCFEGHLKLAMETGYPLAECQLGYFYMEGLGCEQNYDKAMYWTKKAADDGDRDGQFNLGYFYENGIGCEVNLIEAIHWYKEAALQNHDLAIAKCKKLNVSF